jgi:hypothetical protein
MTSAAEKGFRREPRGYIIITSYYNIRNLFFSLGFFFLSCMNSVRWGDLSCPLQYSRDFFSCGVDWFGLAWPGLDWIGLDCNGEEGGWMVIYHSNSTTIVYYAWSLSRWHGLCMGVCWSGIGHEDGHGSGRDPSGYFIYFIVSFDLVPRLFFFFSFGEKGKCLRPGVAPCLLSSFLF